MEQKDRFGAIIREKRKAKGITLRAFADLLGVSPTYVSQVEQGKSLTLPTTARVKAMAHVLGEDPDELFALAGRVADDLPGIIRRHPHEMASLLRVAKGLTADEILYLSEQARKLRKP
jgi:transcriptional regulator with XRE-family HTH domain